MRELFDLEVDFESSAQQFGGAVRVERELLHDPAAPGIVALDIDLFAAEQMHIAYEVVFRRKIVRDERDHLAAPPGDTELVGVLGPHTLPGCVRGEQQSDLVGILHRPGHVAQIHVAGQAVADGILDLERGKTFLHVVHRITTPRRPGWSAHAPSALRS